ncbi:MAG: hypothetical protein IJI41_03115 [Anaerolineaceae bacterium]|nr:hypothetical protein [Anaerolineaceae bacterium]
MARKPRDINDKTSSRRISYAGLEALLDKYGMQKSDLVPLAGVTSNVVAAIAKGEQISMYSAVRLCEFFHVDFSDIMNVTWDPEEDKDFIFAMIVRLAKSTGRDYIDVKRNGDYAELTDKFSDTPSCFFKVSLVPDYSDPDLNGTARKLEQVSVIFKAIDELKPTETKTEKTSTAT